MFPHICDDKSVAKENITNQKQTKTNHYGSTHSGFRPATKTHIDKVNLIKLSLLISYKLSTSLLEPILVLVCDLLLVTQ